TCHFFFPPAAPSHFYTLSLHDALPISRMRKRWTRRACGSRARIDRAASAVVDDDGIERARVVGCVEQNDVVRIFVIVDDDIRVRSEEHTSELQSPYELVCRLLPEKKKK